MNSSSQEVIQKIIEGASKYEEVVTTQAIELIDQTLWYFAFEAALSILRAGAVFVIAYVLYRTFSFFIKAEQEQLEFNKKEYEDLDKQCVADPKDTNAVAYRNRTGEYIASRKSNISTLSAWRLAVSVLSIFAFFILSVPSLKQIGKIMIAPKLFILEKAAEISGLKKEEPKP